MIETAIAQLRFAASVGLGLPFSPRALNRIIDSLLDTRREFGAVASAGGDPLGGEPLDEETRRDVQLRRFRSQAKRAARETDHYRALFARLGFDPARLGWKEIGQVPLASKEQVRDTPGAFVRARAQPVFCTTTTGTTGRPTSLLFSAYEMQTYVALGAINNLISGEVSAEDIVQISTSARATLGNTCFAGACTRVGALVYMGGLIDPWQSLALLAEEHHLPGKKRRASVLLTYASYLGELVEEGLRAGYGPNDFGLERIMAGGEIVTSGLKERSRRLFGDVRFGESFGQTETWPSTATVCPQGHLHFEPTQSLLEVVDAESGIPTPPGEIGTLVLTPLPPYRETMLILRYDTQDLVRALPAPPSCALRHLPAVSNLLGKRSQAVRQDGCWTTPRQVREALEGLEVVPLPARCGFWAVPGGVAVEAMLRDTGQATHREVANALEAHGVPLRTLHLVTDAGALQRPLPLRGDLREHTFSPAVHPLEPAMLVRQA
jgi:phenylacetate-coenzyme A ligase PaaK-like adenylate-forming protein